MKREHGYAIFDNLVHSDGEDAGASQVKYKITAFTSSNASANTREIESIEEVGRIAYEMGQNFTKAFATTS